jgi:RNA polymerase sigma-70 factor (ECF subfamily)
LVSSLLVVLETLAPAERVAFVLHDLFAMPSTRSHPSWGARRRVQGPPMVPDGDLKRRREVIDAFLAASRGGDFDALLALLDPDVVLRADDAAARMGASREVRGAAKVAEIFAGRARAGLPALINGDPGLVWVQQGRPRIVFGFAITRGRIVGIELLADPDRLAQLDLAILNEMP